MNKNKYAFSLIEMIVWISITVILMLSISIFVTQWMKNITFQKKILNQSQSVVSLVQKLWDIFSTNVIVLSNSSTWILLKSSYNLGKPEYYSIDLTTMTWYCENDLSRDVRKLQITNFSTYVSSWILNYSWSQLNHSVYSWWNLIIWKNIFWIKSWTWIWTEYFLNNPTWLAFWSWKLFLSDSWNSQILYLSGNIVWKLLDIDDWIFEPKWLVYTWWKLYILNNGKKELLSYSSTSYNNGIDITFSPDTDITVNKISLTINPNDYTISWSYNTWSYDFWWTIVKNSLDSVSNYLNSMDYRFSSPVNLISGSSYNVKINSFTWVLEGNIYNIKLELYDWWNVKYKNYYPFILKSDNDLTTLSDNELTFITWTLNNYENLSLSWTNLLLEDYFSWEYLKVNRFNGNIISSWTFPKKDISEFEKIVYTHDLIVKDMEVNLDSNLLTLIINYYKNYDCYDERGNILKTIVYKRAISN